MFRSQLAKVLIVTIALALLAVWAISRKRGERSRETLTELQESEQ